MNTDNFKWTDELVEEYIKEYHGTSTFGISHFKQSKQPPIGSKDWEILSFKCNDSIYRKVDNGKFYSDMNIFAFTEKEFLINSSPKSTIHSVRRISDGEVFTVGDMFSNNTAGFYTEEKVCSIEFDKEKNIIKIRTAEGEDKSYYPLDNSLKKLPTPSPKEEKQFIGPASLLEHPKCKKEEDKRIEVNTVWLNKDLTNDYTDGWYAYQFSINTSIHPQRFDAIKQAIESCLTEPKPAPSLQEEKKEVLFTTDDGVNLYNEDDEYWRVYDDFSIGSFRVRDKATYGIILSVSTEELAKAYVLVKQKLNQ